MIPTKETKSLTYQLLEKNFIHLQELRKSMVSAAPSKTFYLFYVDLNRVARMLVEMCYKSLANMMTRRKSEVQSNQRLLNKHERIEAMAQELRNQCGDNEEQLREQMEDLQDAVRSRIFLQTFPISFIESIFFRCHRRRGNTSSSYITAWTSSTAPSRRSTKHSSF